jgi:hypothetical protein
MDLRPYLESLRADLAAAAAPGGSDVARAAELLNRSLEPSVRLILLEVLADAAAEITAGLSDAAVEVRLRGREADLVVSRSHQPGAMPAPPGPMSGSGDLTRLTLRMSESLKAHVEQCAAADRMSVNAWLVRAVTTAVQRPAESPPSPPKPRRGKHLVGFAHA